MECRSCGRREEDVRGWSLDGDYPVCPECAAAPRCTWCGFPLSHTEWVMREGGPTCLRCHTAIMVGQPMFQVVWVEHDKGRNSCD